MERYKTKNENVEKAANAEETLNKIRAAFEEKAKNGDEEAKKLLEKLDAAIKEGEKAGRDNAIKQISAGQNDPANFIISLFKDLEPDSFYSSLNNVYHELQQLEKKSSLPQSLKTAVGYARKLPFVKDINEQDQTFKGKSEEAINNGDIKNVVEWITRVKLLNESVLEPARGEGKVPPDKAKKILQNALDKLTHPEGQTQVEAQGNNQEKTPGEAKNETLESLEAVIYAKKGVASELLEERSKREKYIIKKFITSIKEPDTESLQKANAAILQFSAESQAILKKVALSKEEIKQLQAIQNDLNKAVEDKAKELNVGTQTLTVSEKHLEATTKHIENLMKIKEEEYEKVIEQAITDYHNQVIEIFEELGIPKENIDETLKQRIKRHRELGKLLRKIPNGEESNQQTPIRGFLPNGQTSTDTPK